MDKMREEFEVWASNKGLDVDHICIDGDFKCYCFADTHGAFEIWKASRAALRVELPSAWSLAEHEYKRQVEESLDSAGVSYE